MCLGDLHFEVEDRLGLVLGIGIAGLLEDGSDVLLIGGAIRGHVLVGGEVVLAIGHAEAALHQVADVLRRILQPLRHEQAEQVLGVEVGGVERVGVRAHAAAQPARQRGLVGDRGDAVQLRLQRRKAARFDAGLVHPRGVIVGDLAGVTAGGGIGLVQALHQVGEALLGLLEHVETGAQAGAVGRDLGGLLPRAVGVGVEVVARLHRLVDAGQVDAGGGRGGRRFDGGVGLPCAVGGGLAGGKRSEDGQRQGGVAKGRGRHAGNLAWMTRASCADPDSEHVQEVRRPAAKVALSHPGGAAMIAMEAPAQRSGG